MKGVSSYVIFAAVLLLLLMVTLVLFGSALWNFLNSQLFKVFAG